MNKNLANELRIGNWVKHTDDKVWVKAVRGTPIQVNSETIQDIEFWTGFIPLYDPIPLTPEILKMIGFKYNKIEGIASIDEETPEGDTEYWDFHVKRSDVFDNNGSLSLVRWGESGIWFSNHLLRVKLQYLHQLQNLFHSLTGQELTVKM